MVIRKIGLRWDYGDSGITVTGITVTDYGGLRWDYGDGDYGDSLLNALN
jgi:hypothetical protein